MCGLVQQEPLSNFSISVCYGLSAITYFDSIQNSLKPEGSGNTHTFSAI